MKILPGHTVKLDKIIDKLAMSSYTLQGNDSYDVRSEVSEKVPEPEMNKLKILNNKDIDYERQLERVLN